MLQYQGPLFLTSNKFNHSMDYNYIHYQGWNEITYSLSNFNGVTIEVLWMNKEIDPTLYWAYAYLSMSG